MKTQTIIDPRLEIAETLFEAHSEIRYVLAKPITEKMGLKPRSFRTAFSSTSGF